jgi:hypothetical protein
MKDESTPGGSAEKQMKRFYDKIFYSPDGCWYWTGSTTGNGYGHFATATSTVAHRFSFTVHTGQPCGDLLVCHKCDNKLCVNPDHLFLGTQKDNMMDMVRKGRNKPYIGSKNPLSKLDEKEAKNIKGLLALGLTCALIGKCRKISDRTVSDIKRGQLWKHV